MSVSKLLSRITAPKDIDSSGLSSSKSKKKEREGKGGRDLALFIETVNSNSLVNSYVQDSKMQVKHRKKAHDHTYGITSDPLTQFSCVLAALIHDAGHTGIPNSQLAKENPSLAAVYKDKSIAEQVSVDLAWNLLMQEDYSALRSAIYSNPEELTRFRRLIV